MTWTPVRGDERPHQAGPDPWWSEAWDFDFAAPDASLGGYVRLTLLPNRRTCWYWACLVGAGRDLVSLVDDAVALPRPPSLEIRTEGLWADHLVEEPLDHVSVGCEAFALRLEDPPDGAAGRRGQLRGERTAFGLDLGWETVERAVFADAAGAAPRGAPVVPLVHRGGEQVGYGLPCRVVGEVLVGDERISLDAFGWRRHIWGIDQWRSDGGRAWSLWGRLADGTWLYQDAEAGPGVSSAPSPRRRIEPVAEAPVVVATGDWDDTGLLLARTFCRLTDPAGGHLGAAWTEQVSGGG